MPTAHLRVFRCTSGYDAAGRHVLHQATPDPWRPMPVDLSELLEVNALAAPLDRRLTYRVKRHELNLVLSFLRFPRGDPVAARVDDLKAAARHISAFVVESLGMGMLTAAVRHFHRWTGDHDHLEHFDALPSGLIGAYQRGGVRPDLLFRDPLGLDEGMAGEARGRAARPATRPKPLAKQRQRLDQILGWSARHDHHPVTMAYTSLGGAALSVDLFDVTLPPLSERRPAPPDTPTRPSEPALNVSSEPSDIEPVRGLRAYADTAADHLYESAPPGEETRLLDGARVRGEWVRADLVGDSQARLFLGVLPDQPRAELRNALRERRGFADRASDPVQVDVFGRLIVAVSLGSDFVPPWGEVVGRLE